MTNEQLKILLESQALLLKEALEKAVELMDPNADQELEEKYIGPNKGFSSGMTLKRNPDHYSMEPTGRYLTLIPLYEALETLQRQIDDLTTDFVTIKSGS